MAKLQNISIENKKVQIKKQVKEVKAKPTVYTSNTQAYNTEIELLKKQLKQQRIISVAVGALVLVGGIINVLI